MTTNNHPAHGPVSLDRLHQIREILSKASAQSDGGNLGYAMADAVKVIDGAIASFGAEPVAWRYRYVHTPKTEEHGSPFTTKWKLCDSEDECNPSDCFERQPLYVAPPSPGAVPEVGPVAYIFKHPAGRLFWSLTDESNKGQNDVMPVYASPAPAFVPPAIEPDYEVIKGILPTANPDEYACCIAADMWNACRAAMLQAGNSPVTPDGSEDTKRLDWLDAQNKRLNEYYGTSYGWKFDANFQRNAMMLNDSNYPVMNVRQAIDEAIAEAPKQENI